jgi:hypothetical protein
MVNLDIPKNYTASPSSYGTPHLTINREATVDLDSSNAFEGKIFAPPFFSLIFRIESKLTR